MVLRIAARPRCEQCDMNPTSDVLFVCAFLLIAIAFATVTGVIESRRMCREIERPCAGIRWHRRFPHATHQSIRAFLHVFADAFSVERVHATKFTPDDQPLLIWNARYIPHLTLDDRMEMESLERGINDAYGIDLNTVWRDSMTLGELFALTLNSASDARKSH
jgi:propanediol dehydratase small subunit